MLRIALPILLIAGLLSVPTTAAASAPLAPAPVKATTTADSTEVFSIDNAEFDDAPLVEVSGTIEIVEADATLHADGTPVADAVHSTALLVTDAGSTVELAGELPENLVGGSTFKGTLAISDDVDVAADVLVEAQVAPLAASTQAAEDVLAEASIDSVALPIAQATVVAPAVSAAATVGGHSLYVAVVRPRGSSISHTSFSSTQVRSLVSKLSSYWRGQSGGVIPSISALKIIRYNSNFGCAGQSSAFNWWDEAAAKFGASPSSFSSGTRRHLVVLTPDGSSATGPCAARLGFSGLATVGSSSDDGGRIHSTVGSALGTATLAHEFGHNLSLGHANVAMCSSSNAIEAPGSGCVINDYYDLYDVMGATVVGQRPVPALSLPAKQRLGFVASEDVAIATLNGDSDRSFTEVIRSISGSSGLRGFDVTDPVTGEQYWVEFRSGKGQDANSLSSRDTFSMCVNTCPSKFAFGDGVRILKENPATPTRDTLVVAAGVTAARGVATKQLALDTLDSFSSRSGGVHVDVNWTTPYAASVTVRLTATPTLVPALKGTLVTGYATVGEELHAPVQFFRQPSASLSYQWLRNGAPIGGATGANYTLTAEDVAADVAVKTTAERSGFASATVTSAATVVNATVMQWAPRQQPLQTIVPAPAEVAGSAVTPYVIVVNDEPARSASVALRWIPVARDMPTRSFDEDGISLSRLSWDYGAVEQFVQARSFGRVSDVVTVTPEKATTVTKLSLSSSSARRGSTAVRATVSFVSTGFYDWHPPQGLVHIYEGEKLVASKVLSSKGTATMSIPAYWSAGTRSFTAVFEGDDDHTADSSIVRSLRIY